MLLNRKTTKSSLEPEFLFYRTINKNITEVCNIYARYFIVLLLLRRFLKLVEELLHLLKLYSYLISQDILKKPLMVAGEHFLFK